MASYAANIVDHLKRLIDFRGRESRADFWPFALSIIGLSFVAIAAAMFGPMTDAMRRMQEFARTHPDQATVTSGPGHYSIQIEGHHPELMPDFGSMIGGMSVITVVVVALLAAAVTRRLHDRGWAGFWALVPVALLTSGLLLMPKVMAGDPPEMRLFFLLFFNNLLYIASLAGLIALLVGGSVQGPNKFGEQPA